MNPLKFPRRNRPSKDDSNCTSNDDPPTSTTNDHPYHDDDTDAGGGNDDTSPVSGSSDGVNSHCSTSHADQPTSITSSSTNKSPVLALLNCTRRMGQRDDGAFPTPSPEPSATTPMRRLMTAFTHNSTTDAESKTDPHRFGGRRPVVGNDGTTIVMAAPTTTDVVDDTIILSASTLLMNQSSALSLDGESVITSSGHRHVQINDASSVSSMNSSVGGGFQPTKVVYGGGGPEKLSFYAPAIVDPYDTKDYEDDTPKRQLNNNALFAKNSIVLNNYQTTAVVADDAIPFRKSSSMDGGSHPILSSGNDDHVVPPVANTNPVPYYEMSDAISRSFYTNTRSGRKISSNAATTNDTTTNNHGIVSATTTTTGRMIRGGPRRGSGTGDAPMSPLSPAASSMQEGGGNGYDSESDVNTVETGTMHAFSFAKGGRNSNSPSVACSEDTGDIRSIDDGAFSVTELYATMDHNERQHSFDITGLAHPIIGTYYYNDHAEHHHNSREVPVEHVVSFDTRNDNTSGDDASYEINVVTDVVGPQKKSKKDANKKQQQHRNSVIPIWIQQAPRKLKIVILLVFVLLIVAIVILSAALRDQKNNNSNSSNTSVALQNQHNNRGQGNGDKNTDSDLTVPPQIPKTTERPNNNVIQTMIPVTGMNGTIIPSLTPLSPVPTSTYTMGPTDPIDEETTVVYFMSGPYKQWNVLEPGMKTNATTTNDASYSYVATPKELSRIPSRGGSSFMVHLGDWNSPNNTKCDETTYTDVTQYFSNSSVPVYFVLGDNGTFVLLCPPFVLPFFAGNVFCHGILKLSFNFEFPKIPSMLTTISSLIYILCLDVSEFNDCENPKESKEYWLKHLAGYETEYWDPPDYTVWRQGAQSDKFSDYLENFDFTNDNNVAFCALSMAGGDLADTVSDQEEFMTREDANMAWIHASYQFYRGTIDVLFILVHDALPGSNVANRLFFTMLLDKIKDEYSDLNFVLVHRNAIDDDGSGHWLRSQYNGIPNLSVMSVHGPSWPPLQVTIQAKGDGKMPNIAIDGVDWYYDLWGIKKT